ncbi:glycosyltransferase [Sphingomonas sp. LR60]|uniref:glycosyltransferase n=1 Tax=Sphingomonas sp. LR60 TaxID=3050233 RepID=UPI002FE1EC3A
MPRVSVILPAFNAADTIAATLASVMAQSFADWEVLVVDDGSTDHTIASASRIAAGDTRIQLISQHNQGVSSARNHGIDSAGGELLLFLDADDTIAPEHLALLTNALDAHDAEVAYCGYQRIGSTGSALAPVFEEGIADAPFEAFAHANKVAIHSVLVPRALVRAVGGFDPGLVTCEDWDLWLRIARTGARFVGVATPLAFYRMQPRSLSRDFTRLTADALVVLARARTSDDRVAATPAHQDGSAYDVAIAAGHFVIWAATAAATAGQPVAPLVAMLPSTDFADAETDVVATLRDALAIGGESSDALGRLWEGAAPALAPLLAAIERHASRAGVARRIAYVLERDMVRNDPLDRPLFLTTVCGVRYDVAALDKIEPGSADLLHLRVDSAGAPLFTHELPLLGGLSARDVAQHVLATCGWDDLAPRVRWMQRRGTSARILARRLPGVVKRVSRRHEGRAAWRALTTEAWLTGHPDVVHGPRASAVEADVIRDATERCAAVPPCPAPEIAQRHLPAGDYSRDYWESFFTASDDPWSYDDTYERRKYEQTLALIADLNVEQALEVGCAEGHFSALLAPHVGRLVAADIAQVALDRAAQRCGAHTNVSYRQLDLQGPLPGGFDLTVCSEVLYYVQDADSLLRAAKALRDTLRPGGHLLSAHSLAVQDDPASTGFDWGFAFGADRIAAAFGEAGGLVLERSLRSDLYRIDLWRRDDTPATSAPAVEWIDAALPPRCTSHDPLGRDRGARRGTVPHAGDPRGAGTDVSQRRRR